MMNFSRHLICFLLYGILALMGGTTSWAESDSSAYVIAWSGPLSHPERKVAANLQKEGVEFFIEQTNEQGGINGRMLELRIFDDESDPEIAKKIAREIGESEDIVAAIGHSNSTISLLTAPIYAEHKIPVITVNSTNDNVTKDNPWSFRAVFNDSFQGQFLANYVNSVLGLENIVIIHESEAFGLNLAKSFEKTINQTDVNIVEKLGVDFSDAESAASQIKLLAKKTSELSDKNSIIFLSAATEKAQDTIKILREEGVSIRIIGPDSLAVPVFVDAFRGGEDQTKNKISYLDGVMVAAPMLLDSAGQTAQKMASEFEKKYGHAPDWQSFFAYDAALLISTGIKGFDEDQGASDTKSEREKIRDFLAQRTYAGVGVQGVSGINFFDQEGNAQKPIVIGEFTSGTLISSARQLKPALDADKLPDIELLRTSGDVLPFLGREYFKTKIVYTGLRFNSITDLDFTTKTARINFDMWFRYIGDDNTLDLEFTNALEDQNFPDPSERDKLGDVEYRHYKIDRVFNLNFGPGQPPFGMHQIGVSFKHRFLDQNQLIFVTDLQGVTASTGQKLVQSLNDQSVLKSQDDWYIRDASLLSQPVAQDTLGNPHNLGMRDGFTQSVFNGIIEIAPNELSLRRKISFDSMGIGIIVMVLALLLLAFANSKGLLPTKHALYFIFIVFIGLGVLLLSESFFLNYLTKHGMGTGQTLKHIVMSFDIMWWVVPLLYIHWGVKKFLWLPLERASGRPVPGIAKGSIATILILIGVFGIVGMVFNRPLTSLLATSGMAVMIIGLAIQMNISNVFSGLALNFERPFRIGDVVKLGNNPVGKVVDMGWRTTRVVTGDNTTVCIPNHSVTEMPIENFSFPNNNILQKLEIFIAEDHKPDEILRILREGMETAPAIPHVTVSNIGAFYNGVTERGASYGIGYDIDNYGKRVPLRRHLILNLKKHLQKEGINELTGELRV